MGRDTTGKQFIHTWRIVWMSAWDQDYVDMEVPGHITFKTARSGCFQFGLVQGWMDCRRQGSRVDFTWEGPDEGDDMSGRGFAELVDGKLHGHLYIHLGDDSAFRAVRESVVIDEGGIGPQPSGTA